MKKQRNSYIILALLLLVQVFAVFQWNGCRGFADNFHFSSFDLDLRLIESIHNDHNTPLWLVRGFHNKAEGALFDVFGEYLQFWNLSFLTVFLSFAGVVGLAAQFYYFFARKKKLVISILFGVVLLMPFIEIFGLINRVPFPVRLIFLSLPYLIWSLLGYWNILREKKISIKIISAILILSLWYMLAIPNAGTICALQ